MRFRAIIIRWLALAAISVVFFGGAALYAHEVEEGFWEFYVEWQEVLLIVAIVALSLLIGWVFFDRKNRRQLRRHYAIYEALNIPLWVVDRNANILHSQTQSWECPRCAHDIPIPRADMLRLIREVLEDGVARTHECTVEAKVFCANFQRLSRRDFGQPVVLIFLVEISELASTRAQFEKLAEGSRVTLKCIGESVVVTDAQERVTLFNQASERLFGLPSEAVIGKRWEDAFSRIEGADALMEPLRRTLREGGKSELSVNLILRQEQSLRISCTVAPIRDANGVITGIVLVSRDVTAEDEQRERLRLRNYHLSAAAKLAHMHYFRCPCDETFIDHLKREDFWPKKDGRALDPIEFVNRRDLAAGRKVWTVIMEGLQHEAELFYRLELEGHPIHVSVHLIAPAEGAREIFGVVQDVSELRENAIRYKEMGDLLQLILDHIPDAVFVKDYDNGGRFLLCNRYAREIGLTEESLGKTDYDIYSPALAAKFVADDAAVIRSGRALRMCESLVLPNGSKRECQTVKVSLWRGGRRLVIGICHDVTEMTTSRMALEESNKLLSAILENMPAIIAVKDADNDFRYLVCNRAAERILGCRREDVIGKNNAELKLHTDDYVAQSRAEDERVARTGYEVDRIGVLPLRSGVGLPMRLLKTRIQTGGRTLLLMLIFDTSEQVRLQNERKRLLDEAKLHFEHEKTLNQCLEMVALGKNVLAATRRILEKIGTTAAVDGCCLFRIDPNSGAVWLDDAWLSAGREHLRDAFGAMRLAPDGECMQLLDSGGWISLPNMEKAATVVQEEAVGAFRVLGARALLLTGIRQRGRLWGIAAFLDMDNIRWWSDAHAHLIGSLARIMEIALEARQYVSDLEYSEAEKRLVLDSVDLPILLFDHNAQFVRANKAGRRLAGLFEMSAFVGGGAAGKATVRWPVQPIARDVVADAKLHRRELKVAGREYLMTASPIVDFSGVVKHAVIVGFDMTEFNESNRRLIKAMESARAAEKAKGYFLATMSHELRTPLNAVIGYSELMQTEQLSPQERLEGLKSIHFAGNALLTLVNDILDLSKLEADQMELVREFTDVCALIESIVGVFRLRAQGKNLRLVFEKTTLPYVLIDGVRLRQVLLNIVGNAVKFTERGEIVLSAAFAPGNDGTYSGTLSIAVRDTGPGIDAAYQERIFRPFEQQPQSRVPGNRVYEGTGLGLAISRRLVDRMGGRIELKSAPGEGSVFTVVLESVGFSQKAPDVTIPPPLEQGGNLPKRVMIVDDVQMNLNILEAILKKLGVASTPCLSAKEALEKIKAERPEIIFTDLWMPLIDGESFAKTLRADPLTQDIPLVAITADTQFIQSDENPLFASVLFKPITIGKIQAILHRLGGKQ